uniref:Os02g0607100 protein n=1 Tax=Macrostomum lignano TaxID=282301 RepID=A0A1I8FFB3_9PLAT
AAVAEREEFRVCRAAGRPAEAQRKRRCRPASVGAFCPGADRWRGLRHRRPRLSSRREMVALSRRSGQAATAGGGGRGKVSATDRRHLFGLPADLRREQARAGSASPHRSRQPSCRRHVALRSVVNIVNSLLIDDASDAAFAGFSAGRCLRRPTSTCCGFQLNRRPSQRSPRCRLRGRRLSPSPLNQSIVESGAASSKCCRTLRWPRWRRPSPTCRPLS